MKKNVKWLTALAVVGTIIGLVIAYFCKKNKEESEFDEDDLEDEDDFELDGDLKSVSEREYVPLNKSADQAAAKPEMESGDAEEKDETDLVEDVKKEDKSEAEVKEADEEVTSDKE